MIFRQTDPLHDRSIGLCDCNNFFASCERIIDKTLIGVPVIVLSSNDGCVIARSNESKKLGIKMGEPYFKIKNFCEARGVKVRSSNLAFYSKISASVMDCIRRYTDQIEVYSIDEAFINLNIKSIDDPVAYCRSLREAVWRKCRIPISIGIGPNKTLAKLSAEMAKKSPEKAGVFWMKKELYSDRDGFMKSIPCSEIWMIGKKTADKLAQCGIRNVSQLLAADEVKIKKYFSISTLQTIWELGGQKIYPLVEQHKPPQSIRVSRSFGTPLTTINELTEPLMHFAASAARQLRQQDLSAFKVGVYLSTGFFADEAKRYHCFKQARFRSPLRYDQDIFSAVSGLLIEAYRPGYKYAKCGVSLDDLAGRTAIRQASLFDECDKEECDRKREKITKVADMINDTFSHSLIRPAILFKPKDEEYKWLPKSEFRSDSAPMSPCFAPTGKNVNRSFKSHALDTLM